MKAVNAVAITSACYKVLDRDDYIHNQMFQTALWVKAVLRPSHQFWSLGSHYSAESIRYSLK